MKLLELIKSLEGKLSAKEWEDMRKELYHYAHSGLSSTKDPAKKKDMLKSKVIGFFDYLKERTKGSELTDKIIAKELRKKGVKVNEKLKGVLLRVLKDFLALKQYVEPWQKQQPSYTRDYFLLEKLQELGLKEVVKAELKELKTKISKQNTYNTSPSLNVQDAESLLNAIRLEQMIFHDSIISNNRSEESNILILLEKIEEYYLLLKSKYGFAALTKELVTKAKYPHKRLDALQLDGLQKTFDESNNLLLKVYRELFLLYNVKKRFSNPPSAKEKIEIEKQEGVHLDNTYKLLLTAKEQKLSSKDLRHAYTGLLPFYQKKTAFCWETTYLKKVFTLYEDSVEEGYIFEEKSGKINFQHFKNIVKIAASLEEIEWLEKFIKKHRGKIRIQNDLEQQKYNLICEIELALAKKEYKKATKELENYSNAAKKAAKKEEERTKNPQPQFDDNYEDADYRIYKIKIYYEDNEYDQLANEFRSFNGYLERQLKKSKEEENFLFQMEIYENFIKAVTALKNTRNNMKKDKRDRMSRKVLPIKEIKDIKQYKPIKEQKWLLEKAKALL